MKRLPSRESPWASIAHLGTPVIKPRPKVKRPGGRRRKVIRLQLWEKHSDGERVLCCWCSAPLKEHGLEEGFTIEHVIRLADGGTWDMGNLACACRSCNNQRHVSL